MADELICGSEDGLKGLNSYVEPKLAKLKSPEGTKGWAEGVKSHDLVNIFDFVLFFLSF
jgi:hypothetical protein